MYTVNTLRIILQSEMLYNLVLSSRVSNYQEITTTIENSEWEIVFIDFLFFIFSISNQMNHSQLIFYSIQLNEMK